MELTIENEEEREHLIDALDARAEHLASLGPDYTEDRGVVIAMRMRVEML